MNCSNECQFRQVLTAPDSENQLVHF
uniref:Uncharacterized protein n=1 Tax=Anguilla anguilla TaxID=7936 RepID=A0A0E9UKQ3_ANGAN